MIVLAQENLLVRDDQGTMVSWDIDGWRLDLQKAFLEQGIRELWMVENLLLNLEDKIRQVNQDGGSLSEEELQTLLLNMLMATGYGEVGGEFLKLRQRDVPLPSGAICAWDVRQAGQYLQACLPFGEQESLELGRRCVESLARIGLPGCSQVFLQELAVLLSRQEKETVPADAEPEENASHAPLLEDACAREAQREAQREKQIHWQTQYIRSESWQEVFADDQEIIGMLRNGTVKPLPLSDIFPKVRVRVSLIKLWDSMGGWGAELTLATQLPQKLEVLTQLLARMRQVVGERWPLYRSATECHLLFSDLAEACHDDKKFQEEVQMVLERELHAGAKNLGFDLLITFN